MNVRGMGSAGAAIAAAVALAACGSSSSSSSSPSASAGASGSSAASSGTPFKAAWVYVGPTNDAGWTQAHDVGRKFVQAALGSKVVTTYKENVPEGPQVQQVIESLVKAGNKLIFATSFGFQPALIKEAKLHPDVKFEMATGSATGHNIADYYGAGEDGVFLSGMAAGAASKKGVLGYVSPFPIPEVIRDIDSFTLGAQTTHPGAVVHVVWTNTWFDPATESKAAQSLINAGADVLGQGQDSPATGQVAKAAGLKWTGYDSTQQQKFAPNAWLTAATYNWGPYYLQEVKAAMDGTWKPHSYYGGLRDGFVKMGPFGPSVTAKTTAAILAKQAAIVSGKYYEFQGPIYDQSGKLRVPAGKRLSLGDILGQSWFVKGVIGKIPAGA